MGNIPVNDTFNIVKAEYTPEDTYIYTEDNALVSQLLSNDNHLKLAQTQYPKTAEVQALLDGKAPAVHSHGEYLTAAPVTSVNGKQGVVTLTAADVGALTSVGNLQKQVFYESNTFTAPRTGNYKVTVQASGGALYTPSGGSGALMYTGAGGYGEKIIYLTQGQQEWITVSQSAGVSASFGAYISASAGSPTPNPIGGVAAGADLAIQGGATLGQALPGEGWPLLSIGTTPLSVATLIRTTLNVNVTTIYNPRGYGHGGALWLYGTEYMTVNAGPGIVIVEYIA